MGLAFGATVRAEQDYRAILITKTPENRGHVRVDHSSAAEDVDHDFDGTFGPYFCLF